MDIEPPEERVLRALSHESTGPWTWSLASFLEDWQRVETRTVQPDTVERTIPAEVQESPAGLWDALVQPGQEVELSDGSRLVGLHVLQVEASDEEVVAPDVFGHQVHLQGRERERQSDGVAT